MTEFIQNAKVSRIRVGYQRDGATFIGFDIELDYGGSGQGFGGHCFDKWVEAESKRVIVPEFGQFFQLLLDTFEIAYIDELKGMVVRVKREGEHEFGTLVRAIGHPLKDKWADIRDIFPGAN